MIKIESLMGHSESTKIDPQAVELLKKEVKRSSQRNQEQDLRSSSKAFLYPKKRHKRSDDDPQLRSGGVYPRRANVALEEFIECFVTEFEDKLRAYYLILEGEIEKTGKISGKVGKEVGEAAGGFVGTFLGLSAIGARLGAAVGKSRGVKLGSTIDNKKHTKEAAELLDLIDLSQKDKTNFRRALVEGGFDIFQSFELQFMRVTQDQTRQKAFRLLATDATARAINYMKGKKYISVKDISVSESVILGESKKGGLYNTTPGFKIQYRYTLPMKLRNDEWNTAGLYDKAGVVIEGEGGCKYYKKKGVKSDTTKYGYRRLLARESWNELKKEYDPDDISKNSEFTDYPYAVSSTIPEGRLEDILNNLNSKDKSFEGDRIEEIIMEVKKDILSEIDLLNRQSSIDVESREIFKKIETNLKGLELSKYLEKFKQYFEEDKQERQKMAKSIEENQEENRDNFNQLSRKQDIHHDDNKREHKKTQEGIEKVDKGIEGNNKKIDEIHGVVVTKKNKQTNKIIWFHVKDPVNLFTGRE